MCVFQAMLLERRRSDHLNSNLANSAIDVAFVVEDKGALRVDGTQAGFSEPAPVCVRSAKSSQIASAKIRQFA
jgi:hypothetical protein